MFTDRPQVNISQGEQFLRLNYIRFLDYGHQIDLENWIHHLKNLTFQLDLEKLQYIEIYAVQFLLHICC